MAKRFMYLSIGLLCLVAAYQLGAVNAEAEWDCSAAPGFCGGWAGMWFDSSGLAYSGMVHNGGQREPDYDLPVPPGEVAFLEGSTFIGYLLTKSGEAWYHDDGGTTTEWQYLTTLPGGPVSQQSESWGGVKGRHR